MSIKEKFFYNFGSSVLPMLLSIMIIPELINIIGIERFGILTIAWMIIGYFGLLDIGLGRALTQKVATKIGNSDVQNLRLLIFIIIIVLFFIGVFSGTLIYIFIEKIVLDIFNISNVYHSEVISGLVWVSISIPIVLVSTALFGVLEGQHNFKVISYIRTPLGIMMLIFPLIVVQYTSSLEWILASLFLSRIIVLLILIGTTLYYTKDYYGTKIDIKELISVFHFGGWVFVTNLISPMMVYFDRFYIASILSVSIVAYYTTPFDILLKLLVIPFALVSIMFSSFSTYWGNNNKKVIEYFKKSSLVIAIVMIPIVLFFYLFSFDLLNLWLGKEFALKSYEIVEILSIGIFFNALGMIPFALIQSTGRADITAKIHILELPVYILLLIVLVEEYHIVGVAIAWSIRTFLDALILYYFAIKQLRVTA